MTAGKKYIASPIPGAVPTFSVACRSRSRLSISALRGRAYAARRTSLIVALRIAHVTTSLFVWRHKPSTVNGPRRSMAITRPVRSDAVELRAAARIARFPGKSKSPVAGRQ
jgi:hypothetical protein